MSWETPTMRDHWSLLSFVAGTAAFCVVSLGSGHHLVTVGMAATAVVVGLAGAVAFRARQHRRLVRALDAASEPAELVGTRVRSGQLGDAAFVAGLRRPTIYCDHRLPEQLTAPQLAAVLLHERAHQQAFDPARMLGLDLLAPAVRRLPSGPQWLAAAAARREIRADRYALAHGAERRDLAGALLALPELRHEHVAGFTPAVDLRLRALLGQPAATPTPVLPGRLGSLVAGTTLGALACTWFLHHALAQLGLLCC
jgi:hypothetical protein